MANYYIADLHLRHANVIRLDGRPFTNIEEMEAEIIRRWNKRVTPQDTVYILDPASEKRERLYGDLDTFRQQVKYYWWVDARAHNKESGMGYGLWKQYMERYRTELAELPVSGWAEHFLHEAKEAGITDGTRPQDFVTRQEAAVMVRALL